MQTRRRDPIRAGIALVAILAGLIAIPQAHALPIVHERASTVWGQTIAGPPAKNLESTNSGGAHLDKQSTFNVTYNNFPTWAKNDVQAAIEVWSQNFASTVPITVEATWGRSSTSGILGSARPGNYFEGFAGAPDPTLWYPSALANSLAGYDLDRNSAEIVIQANSDANWDQRNDGKPTSSEYDLESVFIHELGHGLGFLSTDAYDTYFKYGILDQPTPFDAYAQTIDGRRLSDLPSPSLELGVALTNTLVWSGPLGIATNNGIKPLLYTPSHYEVGSSVSHLDESTFAAPSLNSMMTPNLDAGEVFHQPGPLVVAMLQDLMNKPPAGIASTMPLPPRNVQALVGDKSVVITFDLPSNSRTAQIGDYDIKNNRTGQEISVISSPVLIPGLKNGLSYSFSIFSRNALGKSESVQTNSVTPQAAWKSTVLDSLADGEHIATTLFQTQPTIVYTDSKRGSVKVAMWNGKVWRKLTVDGRGGTHGRTLHNVSGPVSVCASGSGKNQILHIFYADLVDKDLRHATFDGTNFKYEIVDGNGPTVQPYQQLIRVRTASDVSVSNACVSTAAAIQVFYRDETQGILLGASKEVSGKWSYEIVDGDRKTDDRTSGDVGVHLRAVAVGSQVSVLYDSVLVVNQQKQATAGEVRLATRTGISSRWNYRTLDTSGGGVAVAGYDLSLNKTAAGVIASWLTASGVSVPKPTQIRWVNLEGKSPPVTITSDGYGLPTSPLSIDNRTITFGCQERICTTDLKSPKGSINLVSNSRNTNPIDSDWVTINKVRYAVASVDGKLALLRP
jgi:hypothetical protein